VPLQINDVSKHLRTFIWEYLDEEVTVTYNLYLFTPELEAEINAGLADDNVAEALVENMLVILVDWDIMDGDEKVPITKDSLMKIPVRLMGDLMQAIGEDAGGDVDEGKGSVAQLRSRNRAQRRQRSGTSSKQQGSFQ